MGTIDASLNIKLGELLTQQTGLLQRFDGGFTQIESSKNSAITTIENKKIEVVNHLQTIITPIVNSIGVAGSFGFGKGVAPDAIASEYGMIGIGDYNNPLSDTYGNYMHALSGSVMVWVPKHYVKYSYDINAPYYGQRIDVSATLASDYKLPRVFVNNGFEVAGVFVDKYKGGLEGNVFVSKRNLDPASTHVDHNPISQCTANGQAPLNRYDGMYAAVKSRGDEFVEMSIFLATMLTDLGDAHYQACYRNNNFAACAWAFTAPYAPKGCNNNALRDANDSSVVYTASGYATCGLSGGVSDSVFAKITHCGQKSGIADVNGLMWEVASGYITDINGVHMVLKEEVDIATLTSANAYDTTLYDVVSIPLTLNNTTVLFGNGTNQFYNGSTDRATNAYKIDSLGLPKDDTAVSTAGASRYGNDGFWRYQRNEMSPIVFGYWVHVSASGSRARSLNAVRGSSNTVVGGRAYLVPRRAG
ncbi:MAG: hypothetical protein IBX44_02465 [Sulfurospirillum sp.]|nr:hypothetical protein [Sulfurospirillum sp.]